MEVKAGRGAPALAAAALLLSFILLFAMPAYAGGAEPGEVRISSVRLVYSLDLWHYSGSYWSVGNAGSAQVRVSDAVMDAYGGVAQYLNATADRASFSVDIPQIVSEFIAEGGSVRTSIEGLYGSDLNRLFDLSSLTVSEDSNERYAFSLNAKFATIRGLNFSDFVHGLTKSIPLIDLDYGANIYAIYGNGLYGTQASGAFDNDNAQVPCSPYIHPSDIADTSGALKGGNEVMIGTHVRASDGYSVGSGTFAEAGACGLSFRYYFDLVFYGTPAGSGEEPEDPGQAQEPQPEPEPEPEITLEAELSLPSETYVGHTVTARDSSTYVVDGERMSAAQAYRNSLAANSFSVSPAGRSSFTPASTVTTREIVFSEPGTYSVRLDISAGGKSAYDVKTIKVLPCPAVKAAVEGTQKQNRKQSLSVTIARDPSRPAVSYEIRIRESASGETVVVTDTETAVCSENIKCRALADAGSDSGFLRLRLDFLTKYPELKTLEFSVTAREGSESDSVSGSFSVIPDEPPTAAVSIPETIYRQQDSNVALIRAEDASVSDDSLERVWRVRPEGGEFAAPESLTDLSFGSGASISFEKTGVGWFDLELTVREVWTEETLEEYISEEDRLGDSVVVTRLVDNVAPVVGFSMRPEETAQLILAADSDESFALATAAAAEASSVLKAEGIASEIHVVRRKAGGVEDEGVFSYGGGYGDIIHRLAGNKLNNRYIDTDFWRRGHYTADDTRIYVFGCESFASEYNAGTFAYVRPDYPYYIKAYDILTGAELWSFTFSRSVFDTTDNFVSSCFAHDFQGRYLYLVNSGRTMIIDKLGGSLVTVLPTALGPYNYLTAGCIYSLSSAGIVKQPLSGGVAAAVLSADIFAGQNCVRLVGDRVAFVRKEAGEIYYVLFDPDDETFSETRLDMTGRGWTGREPVCEAIDTSGVAIIDRYYTYTAFDSSGAVLGEANANISLGAEGSTVSFSAGGEVNYVAGTRMYNGDLHMRISSIYGDETATCSWWGGNGSYTIQGVVDAGVEGAGGRSVFTIPYYVDNYAGSILYSGGTAGAVLEEGLLALGADNLPSGVLPYNASGGWYEGGASIYVYYSGLFNFGNVLLNSESEEGERERLRRKWTDGGSDYSLYLETDSLTTAADIVSAALAVRPQQVSSVPERVYRKGETVSYDISYSDYEGDPSGYSHWVYLHTPMNDGLCSFHGLSLFAPVTSFDKDGRYEVYHLQMDDASRGSGDHRFDKRSDICSFVFYILPDEAEEGISPAGNHAPTVNSITLTPDPVTEGGSYKLTIIVADADGDALDVNLEIFVRGSSAPVYDTSWYGLKPRSGGAYKTLTSRNFTAREGLHEVVVTVSDGSLFGTGQMNFTPLVLRGLTGSVGHTEVWESNRLAYNYKYRGTGKERAENVFWPGEKLVLSAQTEGRATKVSAAVLEHPEWNTELTKSGGSWSGEIWSEEMREVLPSQGQTSLTVRFTAAFGGNVSLIYDVPVVFIQDQGYWMLHRIY